MQLLQVATETAITLCFKVQHLLHPSDCFGPVVVNEGTPVETARAVIVTERVVHEVHHVTQLLKGAIPSR